MQAHHYIPKCLTSLATTVVGYLQSYHELIYCGGSTMTIINGVGEGVWTGIS